jgi:hypothetical protein
MRRILVMAALAACGGQSSDGACTSPTQCDLATGGVCATAPSQKQFCAYPDSTCPGLGGYRWSSFAGDGLASQCFTVPVVTVTLQGAGSGTITSEPSGISCPGTCSAAFPTGPSVRLDVEPASGSGFAGWSGDAAHCGFDAQCTLPLSGAKSATARVEPGGYVAWAIKVEGAPYGQILKIVPAPDGDIMVLGTYSGAGKINGTALPVAPPNPDSFFVARIAPLDGAVRWARGFVVPSNRFVRVHDLAVDADAGDVVVTGYFFVSLDLGGAQPLESDAGGDMFVARFSGTDGSHVWSFVLASTADEPHTHVAVDDGKVVVMGSYDGVIDLGGNMLPAVGNCDVFLIWYSFENGALLADPMPRNHGDAGACISVLDAAVDSGHHPVVTGYFFGTTKFGGDAADPSYTDRGGLDVFVANYDSGGALAWVVTGGGAASSGVDQPRSITIGPGDTVYVTGSLEFVTTTDAMDFNGVALVGSGGVAEEVFIVAISSAGVVNWVRRFGGSGSEEGEALAVDDDGTVVVVGMVGSSVSFDGHPVSVEGPSDAFVCTLSSANGGSVLSAQDYGGLQSDAAVGVVMDAATKHLFMVGDFDSITMLGDKVLTATGSSASFMARIVPGKR